MTTLHLPLEVTLTFTERKLARLIGAMRQRRNDASSVLDRRVDDKASEDIHVQGFAAELAFAHAANVYPDLSTQPRSGGVDCVLPSGIRVDVKSTPRDNGRLITPDYKDKNVDVPDIAVLVTGSAPDNIHEPAKFVIVGWAWWTELTQPIRLRPLKDGKPTFVMQREELRTSLPLLGELPPPEFIEAKGEDLSWMDAGFFE